MKIQTTKKLVELEVELTLNLEELKQVYRAVEEFGDLRRGLPEELHEIRDELQKVLGTTN